MARLDELLARRDSLTSRYLDLTRGLTRVPPGSRLSRFSAASGGAAAGGGGAAARAPGVGAVTVTPGSTGGGQPLGVGLAATQLPRIRERLAGMLPSLTSTIPSSVLTAAGGVAPSASALASAATSAGGAGSLAGAGLEAAQQAASAIDMFGQSGNLLVGGAGFSPLIGPGLSFLPLLWGGTPLSPLSFLSGLGDKPPSAQRRFEQEQQGNRGTVAGALSGATSLPEATAIFNQGVGRAYTPAQFASPDFLTKELGGELFSQAAGGSQGNIAAYSLFDALRRLAPPGALPGIKETAVGYGRPTPLASYPGFEAVAPEEREGYYAARNVAMFPRGRYQDVWENLDALTFPHIEGASPEALFNIWKRSGAPGFGGSYGDWLERRALAEQGISYANL